MSDDFLFFCIFFKGNKVDLMNVDILVGFIKRHNLNEEVSGGVTKKSKRVIGGAGGRLLQVTELDADWSISGEGAGRVTANAKLFLKQAICTTK